MSNINNSERLYNVGFQLLAVWEMEQDRLTYKLTPADDNSKARLTSRAALYAFISGGLVMYIGKTSMTLAQRFAGYRTPGATQSTNAKCNFEIRQLLGQGKAVEILSLAGLTPLRWGEFELNIAAGLEDNLIAELTPPWNGGKWQPMTESEVIEREVMETNEMPIQVDAQVPIAEPPQALNSAPTFRIELGETYYQQGIINPGAKVARLIGDDGELMLIRLGADDMRGVQTVINRKANRNGAPRLYGSRQVARWFQEQFKLGDSVNAVIVSPHEIVLEPSKHD